MSSFLKITAIGDFPAGPVAKTPRFESRGLGFGNWSPHAATRSPNPSTRDPACCSEDQRSCVPQLIPGVDN